MASRASVVKALAASGIKPKHPDYKYYVTKHLIKEFKISDISDKDEKVIENVAKIFANRVKQMYVSQFKYEFNLMLKKKENWFSGNVIQR